MAWLGLLQLALHIGALTLDKQFWGPTVDRNRLRLSGHVKQPRVAKDDEVVPWGIRPQHSQVLQRIGIRLGEVVEPVAIGDGETVPGQWKECARSNQGRTSQRQHDEYGYAALGWVTQMYAAKSVQKLVSTKSGQASERHQELHPEVMPPQLRQDENTANTCPHQQSRG
jgi:hypothetical protein